MQDMKKLIFLLIPLLLTSLACSPVISDNEKQRRVAREQAKKDSEFIREVDVTDAELDSVLKF